ncbi:MAG: hypothetical protein J6R32_00335 [Bacteroidales bacterium]|nr:hypothetical protein [Bacteroidales bacterium]
MASYTLSLRELEAVEGRENLITWFTDYEVSDYLSNEQTAVIAKRGWTKEKLAEHIIDSYYMREIGLETPALFKLKLKVAMREIMEEKLPLIYTACIEYDPSKDYEMKTVTTGQDTSKQDVNGDSLNIHSNTPQGQINKADILNGTYASDTDGSENNSHSNTVNTNSNTSETTGHNISVSRLLEEYRATIRQINREIVEDLSQLFIGIY